MAFRAALGDCLGSSTLIAAVFAHLTDATGTEGDFEGKITSIEASFDFHPLRLKTRELQKGYWGPISREYKKGERDGF